VGTKLKFGLLKELSVHCLISKLDLCLKVLILLRIIEEGLFLGGFFINRYGREFLLRRGGFGLGDWRSGLYGFSAIAHYFPNVIDNRRVEEHSIG